MAREMFNYRGETFVQIRTETPDQLEARGATHGARLMRDAQIERSIYARPLGRSQRVYFGDLANGRRFGPIRCGNQKP